MSLKDSLVGLFDNPGPYSDGYFKIEATERGFRISMGAMYESPCGSGGLTFAKLKEISELFGTDKIDVDDYAISGCETCDYGSDYGHTIDIYEPTRNIEEMKQLVGQDLYGK